MKRTFLAAALLALVILHLMGEAIAKDKSADKGNGQQKDKSTGKEAGQPKDKSTGKEAGQPKYKSTWIGTEQPKDETADQSEPGKGFPFLCLFACHHSSVMLHPNITLVRWSCDHDLTNHSRE